MVTRFTWTQLVKWERDAVRARVPRNIPGLIPKEMASNYKWIMRSADIERNGERTVMNNLWMIRAGFGFFIFGCVYQMWRVLLWGVVELHEHHSYNFDDIVYEKLSTRNVPYHAPVGMP